MDFSRLPSLLPLQEMMTLTVRMKMTCLLMDTVQQTDHLALSWQNISNNWTVDNLIFNKTPKVITLVFLYTKCMSYHCELSRKFSIIILYHVLFHDFIYKSIQTNFLYQLLLFIYSLLKYDILSLITFECFTL